jgi:hypothetical protein
MARIFVISSIGEAGSWRRQTADRVLSRIIEPAVAKLREESVALDIVRGDNDPKQTWIMDRILNAILYDDLVLAVVFEDNANVFYELGIAHSAGRPTVLLRHEAYRMPHDLKDYPYIEFTDADLAAAEDQARGRPVVDQLAASMKAALEGARNQKPFNRELAALGGQNIREKFRDLSYKDWSRVLLDAKREIWLAGTTLKQLADPSNTNFFVAAPDGSGNLTEGANIRSLIAQRVAQGVDATVLMMHEDNPALPEMLLLPEAGSSAGEILDGVRAEIEASYKLWNNAARQVLDAAGSADAKRGTFRVIKVREGCIYQRVTLTDREVITTPYYYTVRFNSGGPAVTALAGSAWHGKWQADLKFLADLNGAGASAVRRLASAPPLGNGAAAASQTPPRGFISGLFRRG